MSRGFGRVQEALIHKFADHPGPYSIYDLAAAVYPGAEIQKRHKDAVNRAVLKLAPVLGLRQTRMGMPRTGGWKSGWAVAGKTVPQRNDAAFQKAHAAIGL